MLEITLPLAKAHTGLDHPTTLKILSDLAAIYLKSGRQREADRLKEFVSRATASSPEAERPEPSAKEILDSTFSGTEHQSDNDSVYTEDTQFSKSDAASSFTNLDVAPADLLESVVMALENDLEILFAHEDLVLFLDRQRFFRKYQPLLKQHLNAVEPDSNEQRMAMRFLRRRRQRQKIAETIRNGVAARIVLVKAAKRASDDQARFERFQLPVNAGVQPHSWSSEDSEHYDIDASSEEGESSEISETDDTRIYTELEENSRSGLGELITLLTTNDCLFNYKTGLKRVIQQNCHPGVLNSILRLENVEVLRGVLIRHFESVAQGEYRWLEELKDLGYNYYDIAELLLDEASQSPWVFLNGLGHHDARIHFNFHARNCIHQMENKLRISPRLIRDDLERPDELKRIIAEHCGLAGILPSSRDTSLWTGCVSFIEDEDSVSITYYLRPASSRLFTRLRDALWRFCGIATYLQENPLCCNAFTVLRFASVDEGQVIELCPINLETAHKLLETLDVYIGTYEPGQEIFSQLSELADNIIHAACEDSNFGTENELDGDICLDKVCLAVQVLNLGLYSYSQAHIGSIQPYFLTKPISQFYLLGCKPPHVGTAWRCIRLVPCQFTCMAGVTGDLVNVFGSSKHENRPSMGQALDLVAIPLDVAETWDARQFIINTAFLEPHRVCAIELGNGYISPVERTSHDLEETNDLVRLHWSVKTQSVNLRRPFSLYRKARIGMVSVNSCCPIAEHRSGQCAEVGMHTLGTSQAYWERSQTQVGLTVGQYAGAQINTTWQKRQEKTLKHSNLKLEIGRSFLQSDWGLQISCCTGVARRISLCTLLADVVPILIEDLLQRPPGWGKLQTQHDMIGALSGANFGHWFDGLDVGLQNDAMRIIRYVLSILGDTGIDDSGDSGDHHVAIWPRKDNPLGCMRIPCKKDTLWARMLQDSEHCATFAYINPLCLETQQWKCQKKETARWYNKSVALNTQVSLYIKQHHGVSSNDRSQLKNKQTYLVDPRGKYLIGKALVPNSPTTMYALPEICVSPSILPGGVQARLKEHLREKHFANARAQRVIVLTKQSQSFILPFR